MQRVSAFRCFLHVCVLLVVPGSLSWAGLPESQLYIYAVNGDGKLSANGTVLDSLGGDDEDSTKVTSGLIVSGNDRYALRRDGQIKVNGDKLADHSAGNGWPLLWSGLALNGTSVLALRQDGLIAVDKDDEVDFLPLGEFPFFFRDMIAADGDSYSLRTDGSVYRNTSSDRLFRFNAPDGAYDNDDGEDIDTLWIAHRISPTNPLLLYGLRSDGNLYVGPLTSVEENPATEQVASMPFPNSPPIYVEDLYTDLEFTADGTWVVLRANGEVYTADSAISPVVDYPGDGSDNDHTFFDLATAANTFVALRGDGRVYIGESTEEAFDAPGDHYSRVAVSTEVPNLDNAKNAKPVTAKYTTNTNVGTALSIPVLPSDTMSTPDELIVTPLEPLPTGAVWDADERRLVWDSPGPKGTYKFSFTVDDGVNGAKKITHSIKVKDPDLVVEKNKKPLVCSISDLQVISRQSIEFDFIVDDPDGDAVTVSVDPTVYPFTAGATFVGATRTFTWTPTDLDLGKVKVQFLTSDGVETVKKDVTIKVVEGFIIEGIDAP